jgi:N-acetyl-anhydromuramyl-L-alanine amidase AmpD
MKYLAGVVFFILCIIIISSCARNPYTTTNKVYKKQVKEHAKLLREYPVADSAGLNYASSWAGTTNFSMRRPNFVVIHHTAQNSCDQTLKTFTLARTQVSAHYVVCKDGTVHHMLNDLLRAHHAYDTTAITIPDGFNEMQALRIIGYDIKNPANAIQSFKLHFVQADSSKTISDADKKILADLVKKYQ